MRKPKNNQIHLSGPVESPRSSRTLEVLGRLISLLDVGLQLDALQLGLDLHRRGGVAGHLWGAVTDPLKPTEKKKRSSKGTHLRPTELF